MGLDNLSVFGGFGFVGSEFVRQNPEVVVQDKYDYHSKTSRALTFISTTHNYNIFDRPYLDIDTNLLILIEILEHMRKEHESNSELSFISSWFVYGDVDCPAREDSCCNPKGFYSITKRAAEQLLISYCETFGMKWRILRLANIIGIGDRKISRKKNALQYMISEVAKGNGIDYLYQGDYHRDYMDVRDCERAIKLVLEKGNTNEIYNIGNGVPVNINDTVFMARYISGKESNISFMDVPEFHKQVQVKDMWLDNSKISRLGYRPEFSIADTVTDLVEYYQNERT